jgi:phosphoribosyl 1,2-cyclic phosphate phosphodiesterase
MKARVLGSGTSSGVPRIGNDWGVCDPSEPRNRRTRASILISSANSRILVDTSPDMRAQLLDADVADIDAVIWTHDHADHCHGLDDLRQVYHVKGKPVDGFARQQTLDSLHERFGYAFLGRDGYPPTIDGHRLPDQLMIGDIAVSVVDQPHGNIMSAGLRFDVDGRSIAYSTDINEMTDEVEKLFEGLDLWIVDALRESPHPTHTHLAKTLGWIDRLKPKHVVLVHMDQSMDYATLARALPAGVEPGYDGLEIELA